MKYQTPRFKSLVAPILSCIVKLVVVISIYYVIQTLVEILGTQPYYKIEMQELRNVFGSILFILVALELNYILVSYAREDKIQIHAVLIVLIITYARKLIVFDLETMGDPNALSLFASAFVILSAGFIYWLFSRPCSPPQQAAPVNRENASLVINAPASLQAQQSKGNAITPINGVEPVVTLRH